MTDLAAALERRAERDRLRARRDEALVALALSPADPQRLEAEVAELTARLGELVGVDDEVAEAEKAEVLPLLAAADAKLDSAASYSTGDLFLNGSLGLQADLLEHSRANEASYLVFKANAALQRLAGHLATMGRSASKAIEFGPLARNLDLYWDDLATDLYTRMRLAEAQGKLSELQGAVAAILTGIDHERGLNAKETDELRAEQATLRGS